mmetsp:Transcript_80706/g.261563  ORF Transcript_80706/g.261563 Transcript_80706/m.261563 type:complete len:583 (+) Transcript_80706:77-1825(+)
MDPFKVLGLSERQVNKPSDLDVARHRAKRLYKRYLSEKKKFDAKKVLEAFDMVKRKLKNRPGEGVYKIIGRSRKERELDKHFNHQTKEIRKNKDLKRTLRKAKSGHQGIHLPGQKERIPRPRRKRRRVSAKSKNVDTLQGLRRLAAVLPHQQKFPKVIKLLHRWMREYMNFENREYVFDVLHGIAKCDFITEDPEARQELVQVFEYALGYFSSWFESADDHRMLGRCWHIGTVLACRCYTDDPFILSSALAKLTELLGLLESHRDELALIDAGQEEGSKARRIDAKLEEGSKARLIDAKLEEGSKAELIDAKLGGHPKAEVIEAKLEEVGDAARIEAKLEGGSLKPEQGRVATKPEQAACGMALPVACPSPALSRWPSGSPRSEAESDVEEVESLGSSDSVESLGSTDDEIKGEAIDLEDSDVDCLEVKAEISSGSCSEDVESDEGDDDEVECSLFAVPSVAESLRQLRAHFVGRCLAALFMQRGPLWARPKIDPFFQDVFYRRSIFAQEQRVQVEAWQARIKALQRFGEREVGEANNPLEAHRPVVDSREMMVTFDADSNSWAAKQTFDSRDKNGARQVIR